MDAVFSPGQTLGAGIVLDRDVRVEAVSTLAPEYFQNGFSNYEVNGHRGVHVTEGASIDVAMPVAQAALAGPLSSEVRPRIQKAETPAIKDLAR